MSGGKKWLPVSAVVLRHEPRPFGRGSCLVIGVSEAEAQVCASRPRNGRQGRRRRRWGQRRATDIEPEVTAAGSVRPRSVRQRATGTGQRERQHSGDRARDLQGRTYSRFRQQNVPLYRLLVLARPPVATVTRSVVGRMSPSCPGSHQGTAGPDTGGI